MGNVSHDENGGAVWGGNRKVSNNLLIRTAVSSGDVVRMHVEQDPAVLQISMPCSSTATAFKLASPMEIVENKRSLLARYTCQSREGWRATDFGIQSAFWQIVGRLLNRGDNFESDQGDTYHTR